MTPFRQILVPTDFSEHARQALRIAADLAGHYGAALTLLHVHEPIPYELPSGHVMNMPSQLDQIYAQLNQRLEDERVLASGAGATRVETRLLQGPVVNEINRFAKGFDLVILGARGLSKPGARRLGAVAERVIDGAPCPVLAVRLPQV
jgi:nucleotide-binding universal stress UspA family protein